MLLFASRSLVAGGIALAIGCKLDAQTPTPVAPIVHRYPSAALPPEQWTTARLDMSIGGSLADGSSLLVDVVGAFIVRGTRLIIADGKSSEFRVFSVPDGRHVKTFGRRGQGPGEIADLWAAWRSSSALVAEDAAGKASLFSLDGQFERTLPRGVDATGRRVDRLGVFNDTLSLGKLLDDTPVLQPGESRTLNMQLLAMTDRSSRVIATLEERMLVAATSGRPRPQVFGPRGVAAVIGARVCAGYPLRYVIDCYSPSGQLLTRTERESFRALPVTAAHKEDYIASESTANLGPTNPAYVARLRATAPFARALPLFGEFVAASNGDLWVGPYVPVGPIPAKRTFPRQSTIWSVYGVDGRWKADATLPARFQLMSVDGMRVVGVLRDDDDAESVVVYTMRKR